MFFNFFKVKTLWCCRDILTVKKCLISFALFVGLICYERQVDFYQLSESHEIVTTWVPLPHHPIMLLRQTTIEDDDAYMIIIELIVYILLAPLKSLHLAVGKSTKNLCSHLKNCCLQSSIHSWRLWWGMEISRLVCG